MTDKTKLSKPHQLIGWVILDKDNIVHNFYPKTKHFYGAIVDAEEPSREYLDLVDRDWAGLAPHKVKEVFIEIPTPTDSEVWNRY